MFLQAFLNPLLFLQSLFTNSERAKEFLTKPTQLVESSNFQKDDIRGRNYAGLMMYFMSKICEHDIFPFLHEVIESIAKISQDGDIEYIESILYYVLDKADSERVDGIFSEFKKAVTIEHSEVIMTIAERLEQRGKERGILKGKEAGIQIGIEKGIEKVALNMLLKKLDEKIVAESTGLSLEKIKSLRKN